jgi:hypothetical protein
MSRALNTVATPTSYVGWHKPRGGVWVQVCEAAAYGSAWSLLLYRLLAEGRGGDSTVLPQGTHPGGQGTRRK